MDARSGRVRLESGLRASRVGLASTAMAGVFISHAFADKALVDPFEDDVLRLGCEVPRKQIFYSSGEDTGVPSGANLNTYVRDQVAEASIAVAVISPTFQSPPFCVAELGAGIEQVRQSVPMRSGSRTSRATLTSCRPCAS